MRLATENASQNLLEIWRSEQKSEGIAYNATRILPHSPEAVILQEGSW